MGKILLVVESPGKVKKVQSYVGDGYIVAASVGHIMDLDSSGMSVDIGNKFKPEYRPSPNKLQVIKNLKKLSKKASGVLIATDMDREGEMIGWSIAYILHLKNPKRLVFHSITRSELQKSLKNPIDLNNDLISAQKARRILDRIVGYELSPVLWKGFNINKLSAGRVQSVVTRLIVDKEKEIENFMEKDDQSTFKFVMETKNFKATMHDKKNGYSGPVSNIEDKSKAKKVMKKLSKSTFKIANIINKERKSSASPPFTTYTLQQEASRKLGFGTKLTMSVAQKLYEEGHITYMRTDSVNLSKEALKDIKKYVVKNYGKEYYQKKEYKAKTKNVQEAHEACRVTHVTTVDVPLGGKIGKQEQKLYKLIWRRTVASQMTQAIYDVNVIQIKISKIDDKFFEATLESLKFNGWLAAYGIDVEDDIVMKVIKGDKIEYEKITGREEYKTPPSRYSEATLVQKLKPDNLNIGRPATTANIITTIQDRGYVKKGSVDGKSVDALILTLEKGKVAEKNKKVKIGHDKNKLLPTELGRKVTGFLLDNFPDVMEYKFTSNMEEELDEISNGNKVWHKVLKKFYNKFHPLIVQTTTILDVDGDKNSRILGKDPKTKKEVIATCGKWGPYVRFVDVKSGAKILPPLTLEKITLKDALKLLKYPKNLGKFKKKDVLLKKSEHGFYVECGKERANTGDKKITLEDAIKLLEDKKIKNDNKLEFRNGPKKYTVYKNGKYGAFLRIQKGKYAKNISLPTSFDLDNVTLESVESLFSDSK